MTRLYYHHVAKKGLEHLNLTVFTAVDVSVLANNLAPDIYQRIADDVRTRFPSGKFNCWGAPAPAASVMAKLQPGDYVLLVDHGGPDGEMSALCQVKVVVPGVQTELSQALWDSPHYPLIYLFDSELLDLRWFDFLDHLGYPHSMLLMGLVYSVADERLVAYGGADGYAAMLRSRYHRAGAGIFRPASREEVRRETETQGTTTAPASAGMGRDVDTALGHLQALASQPDPPSLTSDAGTNLRPTKVRDAAFAIAVKRLYGNRCAVCGLGALGPSGETVVEAAHIYPKACDGSDDVRNGICLCRLHHWAFDVGWWALGDGCEILLHPTLPEGQDYDFIRSHAGRTTWRPDDPALRPHPLFLQARRRLSAGA